LIEIKISHFPICYRGRYSSCLQLLDKAALEGIRMGVDLIGALCFGIIVGWITYRTLRRQGETVALSNIATVIGAIGGGAVTALFKSPELFGYYSIGLFFGFFGYLVLGNTLLKDSGWLGDGT
jgi:uncharacterized membrane protein YeaQ/YmgE (transglycosylase-associated protein family)